MRYTMIASVLLGALSCTVSASADKSWIISFYKTSFCKSEDNVDSEGDSVGYGCTNIGSSVELKGASFEAEGTWIATVYTKDNCGGDSYTLQNSKDQCISPNLGFGDQPSWKSYDVGDANR